MRMTEPEAFKGTLLQPGPSAADNLLAITWNSAEDYLRVESRVVYLDEIVAIRRHEYSDPFTLIVYLLDGRKRTRKELVIRPPDGHANFFITLQMKLRPRTPPHSPRYMMPVERDDSNSEGSSELKMLVLVNPFSGQKRANALWEEFGRPIFTESSTLAFDLRFTNRQGEAMEIAQNLDLDAFAGIAVVSGDGLVSEVINGLLMRRDRLRALRLPILHIPGGTSNGLAAAVAYQANEPFSARGIFCRELALMAVRPSYKPLRLYHVQLADGGSTVHRAMFMSLSWGLMADIDLGSERFRAFGMIRLHIEATLRIMQLPSVARYKARISYLPVPELLRKTRLKENELRERFGPEHFRTEEVDNVSQHNLPSGTGSEGGVAEAFEGTQLVQMPPLDEPAPANWETVEGEFVFVHLSSLSHLGSDLPFIPCARLDEAPFYLAFIDWRTIKSRFHIAQLMITIDRSAHLDHPCLQIIPVMACRVEPAHGTGGFVSLDGEPCTPGAAFQVASTKLTATLIGREERR